MKDNLKKMRGEIEKLEGFNLYKEYCIFRKKLVVEMVVFKIMLPISSLYYYYTSNSLRK